MPKEITFMQVTFQLSTKTEVLEAIDTATTEQSIRIATLNPEFMLLAQHNQHFREALSQMTHCIIDGAGLYFALRMSGIRAERYAGSTLMANLFEKYSDGSKSFFLVGGKVNHAQDAVRTISQKYPLITTINGTDGGIIEKNPIKVDPALISTIQSAKTDVLFVGFGAPKQELWIQAAIKDKPANVMIGVGGSFGFYTNKKRAPEWMRTLYLEWLYRGLTESGHWKRVIRAVIIFPLQVVGWMIHKKL
jgi:N-acetylglucosaminyldiphosphoundecaprenol N-acetyl-beta-D-mannosaminyltransferase